MAASIIRLEQENEELRAEVALLREERAILQQKFAGVIEGNVDSLAVTRQQSAESDLSPRANVTKVRGVPIEELREEVALLREERGILRQERIELAKQLRSEREMHAACQNERDALADELRKGRAR